MNEVARPQETGAAVRQIGPCSYYDPFLGKCPNSGVRLLLRDCLDRLVLRTLCRVHSDFIEAKP